MSSLLNQSLNGSNSNLPDSTARPFTSSFTAQSAAASPAFHHSGTMQGLHNMHGNFSVPNMPGNLTSRNSTINGAPSNGGVQQPIGSLSSGRFTSNNIPVALSQMSHASSHGHSGITNRGGMNIVGSTQYSGSMNGVSGSIPGIPPTSTAVNRSAVPGLVSPMMGNAGARITNSMGNIVGGGNIGRNINSGGGLSVSGLASRLNLAGNSGSGSLSAQGPNRLMGATPQVMSMLNSYPSGGGQLSQSQVQASNNLSSMGMLNDMNSNDNSPFDINDFPQLNGRPSSAGGPQGQMGSMRKQSVGVSPIVQQNQEFSIQNEDFPALPGFKGGNADYGMDMHQKEQYHDNSVSMMQSQHFPMGRSAGFNFAGSYSSQRAQQQQQQQQQQQLHAPSVSSSGMSFTSTNNQDLHLHGSDLFPSSHATYHSQTSGSPSIGLRQLNSQNSLSGLGSYDHLIQLQHYQQQNQSQFRLQQMSAVNQSYRDHNLKSMQMAQASPDRYGLLGLLKVIRMSDPDLTSLALGIDLTTLGLNLNSTENLHKAFGSPWSDEPAKGEPEFAVPECYYSKEPPVLHQAYFSKFQSETLFYIFYSMPRDEAQLYAANELYNRGWFYHKELKAWLVRAPNMEPLVKTNTYERGSYLYFDSNTWETVRKDNFVLYYELLEQRPPMAPSH